MSFSNNQEEAKALIEEQGKLVKQFREEVVEKFDKQEHKVKEYVSEKDAKMSGRLEDIETRLNTLTRPDGQLKSVDTEKTEYKSLLFDYLQTPHRDWHGEKAIRLNELQGMYHKNVLAATSSEGGVLIPEEMEDQIYDNFTEVDAIVGEVGTINVRGQSLKFNIGQDATADWFGETTGYASVTESLDGSFTQDEITNYELLGRVQVSKEALEDIPNIENYVVGRLSVAMGAKLAETLIDGNGTGKPKGIDQASASDPITFLRPNIETVTASASANPFDFDHFVALVYEKTKPAYYANGKFAFNRDTLSKLRKIQDSNGQYLWNPAPALDNPGTILGFPYFICPNLDSTANSAGSYQPVYFSDFKQSYLMTRRLGMSIERLNEVAWPMVQMISRMRVGGQVVKGEALSRLTYTLS